MAAHNNVMISSTVRDLPHHRREVMDACLRLDLFPMMMEQLPSSDAGAIRDSLRLVDDSDFYLGVLAHRYGYIPNGHDISITEMEYNRAIERKIPRFIFIMAAEHQILIADVEVDQLTKLGEFKNRLTRENTVSFFTSPADLRAHVIYSLSQHLKRSAIPIQLTGQRKSLHEGLIDTAPNLGRMYRGAMEALEQQTNPERLVSAAHLIRELMEKLPKYLNLPVLAKPPSLKEKVQELVRKRETALKKSNCRREDGWRGEIDWYLKSFLEGADEFFDWFRDTHPTRRDRIAGVIRRLDPSGRALPEVLERKQIEFWDSCNGYFQGISHHTIEGADKEFNRKLSDLEGFLLDRLAPRTFDDFAMIDALIKEGEKDDQS